MIGLVVVTCLEPFAAVIAVPPTAACAPDEVTEFSCSSQAYKLSLSSDDGAIDEVASIAPDLAFGDGNAEFADGHGVADSAIADGKVELTKACDEATFTTPDLATGDCKMTFATTEDEFAAFAAPGVAWGDGVVDFREAEGEETLRSPDFLIGDGVGVQHS
jgi:hypothetical protein